MGSAEVTYLLRKAPSLFIDKHIQLLIIVKMTAGLLHGRNAGAAACFYTGGRTFMRADWVYRRAGCCCTYPLLF